MIRACVVGLLRGGKVRVELAGIGEITSVRDEGARELLKDTGLKKAQITENKVETLAPRDRNAICLFFKEQLGKDVARDNDAIANAVADRFAGVRERLTEVAERFRRLPKDTAYPPALTKLETALEACRRNRRVEPTVLAVKRALPALRDGVTLLRRMETNLTDAATQALRDAEGVHTHVWPGLAALPTALAPSEDVRAAAQAIQAHLEMGRPWEDIPELLAHVEVVREAYRRRRRAMLDAHEKGLDLAIERIKRRSGFERLDPDQHHQVLRHLREGGASGTDERAIAPALEALEGQLAARRQAAEAKALAQLDVLLEALGGIPVVEVALELEGRRSPPRASWSGSSTTCGAASTTELAAGHRVRLR